MFNPLKMAGDMKGIEKMLKPAFEKFMHMENQIQSLKVELFCFLRDFHVILPTIRNNSIRCLAHLERQKDPDCP